MVYLLLEGSDNMLYDAVIVGGGPSGAATGLTLAVSGAKVCILERSMLPRRKTCAGILTEKTVKLLGEIFPEIRLENYCSTKEITLQSGANGICKFSSLYPFVLINRETFDFDLLNACKRAGVDVLAGMEVAQLFPQSSELILQNNCRISYGALIAADGVHSRLRRWLGIPDIQKGFCIQDVIERAGCPESLQNINGIHLSFGSSIGYSWVIPNRTHIIVGTGVLENNHVWKSTLEIHEKLCKQLRLPTSAVRTGAHVPIGQLASQEALSYENIALVGDAAGLAHPLTGEGIYYALLSGQFAGNAFRQEGTKFRTAYLRLLKDTSDSLVQDAKLLQQFYNEKMLKNLIMQLGDSPEYLADICNNVVSVNKRSFDSALVEIQRLLK